MTTRNRRTVILISRPSDELHGIRQTLEQNRYAVHVVENIESLNQVLADVSADCVILDLDALDVDNPTIRKLTIEFPQIYFLCMSKNRFHPELKDAICYHIYACLTKPLDHDELRYWLRCIENDVASPE
jgi:DNA-binding NtrC family response regulator